MSNLTERLCLEAREVASSQLLRILLIIKSLMSIGCGICVGGMFKKGFAWIPNPNAKLLYKAHLSIAMYCSVIFSFVYIYAVILYSQSIDLANPCQFVFNARVACACRGIAVVGVITQSLNMFSFAIERSIATFFGRAYESATKPYFGIFLVFASSIFAILILLFFYYLPVSGDAYVSTFTLRNPQNNESYQTGVYLCMGIETTTISLFAITYYQNVRKGNGQRLHSRSVGLGDRYQFFNKFDPITSAAWIEAVAHAQNYGLLMPFILLWQTRKRGGVSPYGGQAATQTHFQLLTKAWH